MEHRALDQMSPLMFDITDHQPAIGWYLNILHDWETLEINQICRFVYGKNLFHGTSVNGAYQYRAANANGYLGGTLSAFIFGELESFYPGQVRCVIKFCIFCC